MEPESSRFEKGKQTYKTSIFWVFHVSFVTLKKIDILERIHQQSTSNVSNLRKWRVVTSPNGGEQMGNDHARY